MLYNKNKNGLLMFDLLIKNIGVLATPKGKKSLSGNNQKKISLLKDVSIGIKKGIIEYIGVSNYSKAKKIVDAKGLLVTPGLVDSHTHLIFGGWRENEIPLKLSGASYMEILSSGGGILSTVKHTREESQKSLYNKTYKLLNDIMRCGTTTLEAKSGYGLTLKDEIKQLEIANELNKKHKMDIVSTFMGAHAIADEYKNNRDEYINLICKKMIPKIASLKLAEFCDIFCENGVFTVSESEKILKTAKKYGFGLKIHADELETSGGALLSAKLKAKSAEHLIQTDYRGIEAMAKSGTIAVLLPSTSFYLDKPFAKARTIIEKNVPVAIASDFNPGSSPGFNLQLSMNIAYIKYKLTPEEILVATTLNGASAINRADITGTIEVGKQADILIWNAKNLNYIIYRFGNNLVKTVVKKGVVIYNL